MKSQDDLRITDILGNELAKRAIEVAAVQGSSIGFIGGETAQRLTIIAGQFGIPAFACKPCPCGNYGNVYHECHCSLLKIQQHLRSEQVLAVKGADIVIEVDERVNLKSGGGEKEETIRTRIASAVHHLTTIPAEYVDSRDSQGMEKLAKSDMRLTDEDMEKIHRVARSIMALNRRSVVSVDCLCEAIQYSSASIFKYRMRFMG